MSDTEIIIMPLNYNGADLLAQCLPALKSAVENTSIKCEICVIDNNSTDSSKDYVKNNHPEVSFISYSANRYLASYNEAIKQTKVPYILILNNDMIPDRNFIEPLYKRIKQNKDFFAVSPQVECKNKTESYSERLGAKFFHGHLAPKGVDNEPGGTLYFHGGAALINRDKFMELGGFDPLYFYFEDNDLSYRAWKKGYQCIFEPNSVVTHLGSVTVDREFGQAKKVAIKEKSSSIFVLKNISHQPWLKNFQTWSYLKFFKILWNIDTDRLNAAIEVMQLKSTLEVNPSGNISDPDLISKIESLKLPRLNS
jgi:N-acetylglucosaminyl-diphospho-decaprenol L-rhamnosyltransferase